MLVYQRVGGLFMDQVPRRMAIGSCGASINSVRTGFSKDTRYGSLAPLGGNHGIQYIYIYSIHNIYIYT